MNKRVKFAVLLFALILILPAIGAAQILPPELPWQGQSEKFMRPADDPWVTPAEKSGLTQTPDYAAAIDWLHKLTGKSPNLTMQPIGKSGQNRDMWLIIATEKGNDNPAALRKNGRPTLLFHGGIHSGEIDGKDAGMMFLRDVVSNNPGLLKKINILFIPVLNPDGHENSSKYARVNQRGPEKMGWRTNARNLNLNRDYTKLETPEVQNLMRVLQKWPVDLYIDIHVTDGIDYQADITYGFTVKNAWSPNISQWMHDKLSVTVDAALRKYGHFPAPLIFAMDNKNLDKGIVNWTASPRYSNGYGDARHLPTILVENHSLKPFKQRVLGTYVFLQAVSQYLAENGDGLRKATAADRKSRDKNLAVTFKYDTKSAPGDSFDFGSVEYEKFNSEISGSEEVRWLGKTKQMKLPWYSQVIDKKIELPRAYWIPASRPELIEKLQLHGVELEIIDNVRTVTVELYRLEKYKLARAPFEGRVRLGIDSISTEMQEVTYYPGSARISTEQPSRDLAALLLEPYSPASFIQWGYFHELLQRTEYIEGYVVEPLARKMLEENPQLKVDFEKALQNEKFAKNPRARLQWFYQRSPYYDRRYLLYPVGREK